MKQFGRAATAATAVCLLLLAGCGGGGSGSTLSRRPPEPPARPPDPPLTASSPAFHLRTARFTTHQPNVLERIGSHHAYARGLTGRGVRIGIDDTIVDYTQTAEFGSRVRLRDADGATLSYLRPFGDEPSSDVRTCLRLRTCRGYRADSQGDDEARNRWVRQIVRQDGWPTRDDSVFVLDEHYSEGNPFERLLRWSEVPTPYGQQGSHGTAVASVAAGRNLGVAPGATIIPIAQNLSDDQRENAFASSALRYAISRLPAAERRALDNALASQQRTLWSKFDIVNRSYGRAQFDPEVEARNIGSELRWYRRYLPNYLRAGLQADRPDAEKSILVYAAGNDGEPYSGLGADYPFYIPELRGHSLSVVATNPRTGVIADYSNRCGAVPRDWNAARYGPHFCLAAPGTARALLPNPNSPGRGSVAEVRGTSFAAPVVSGSLALLMEHFRGTRGNTAIVKRMLDTADRSGRYGDLETYGAGHLDLEAALSPVGTLNAGQSARALNRTALQTPAAFGAIARRAVSVELAAFDEQEFPFWLPLSALISERSSGRSPIPRFANTERAATAPAHGLEILGMHWMQVGGDGSGRPSDETKQQWAMGFGPTSASIARLPPDDGWGYGLSFDDGGHLGTRTSGAFDTDLRSGTIWVSRAFTRDLGDGWRLDATGTLAYSQPQYGKDAMFRASPSLLSAMSVRVGTKTTGVTLEQPLRAESGSGTFRLENGRLENGRRLYDTYRVPLRPDGRELRMTFRHEREALGGNIAIEAGGAIDAGHVEGEPEFSAGFAYRMTW